MLTTLKQHSAVSLLPATSSSAHLQVLMSPIPGHMHIKSPKQGLHLHQNLTGPPQTTMPDFKSGLTTFVTSLHSRPTSDVWHRLPWSSKATCMSSENVQGINWGISDLAEIFICTCPDLFSQQNEASQPANFSFLLFLPFPHHLAALPVFRRHQSRFGHQTKRDSDHQSIPLRHWILSKRVRA